MAFDKRRFLDNVYYLAKLRDIKIGVLEANANLSTGYLARLNKEDNKSVPSIEVLVSFAEMLDVSMDSLINCDLEPMSGNDIYVCEFLDKLICDTTDNKLIWTKEDGSLLHSTERGAEHPLLKNVGEHSFYNNHYQSQFRPNEEIELDDGQYYVKIGEDVFLYLMNTLVNLRSAKNEEINSVNEIELYLVNNQLVKKICRKHYKQPSPFDDKLLQLRQAAKDSTKHVNLDQDLREVIDLFMAGQDIKL